MKQKRTNRPARNRTTKTTEKCTTCGEETAIRTTRYRVNHTHGTKSKPTLKPIRYIQKCRRRECRTIERGEYK